MHIVFFFVAAVSTVVGIIIISALIAEGTTKVEHIYGVSVPADSLSLALAAFFATFAFICLGNMVRHFKNRAKEDEKSGASQEASWSDKDNE